MNLAKIITVWLLIYFSIFSGYKIPTIIEDFSEPTKQNFDYGYALEINTVYLDENNLYKKYEKHESINYFTDERFVTLTDKDKVEIQLFTEKFYTGTDFYYEENEHFFDQLNLVPVQIHSSKCGTGDWLCFNEKPTRVYFELVSHTDVFISDEIIDRNPRILEKQWLDINNDGKSAWVFDIEIDYPEDPNIVPIYTFFISFYTQEQSTTKPITEIPIIDRSNFGDSSLEWKE